MFSPGLNSVSDGWPTSASERKDVHVLSLFASVSFRSSTWLTERSWCHYRSWLRSSPLRTDKQQCNSLCHCSSFCTDTHPTLAVCMQYNTRFPLGEMFLLTPGKRKGFDRFKALGLILSGITDLISKREIYTRGKTHVGVRSQFTFRIIKTYSFFISFLFVRMHFLFKLLVWKHSILTWENNM